MKKLLSIIFACILLVTMTVTVFAEDNYVTVGKNKVYYGRSYRNKSVGRGVRVYRRYNREKIRKMILKGKMNYTITGNTIPVVISTQKPAPTAAPVVIPTQKPAPTATPAAPTAAPVTPATAPNGYQPSAEEMELIRLTNVERGKAGLSALAVDYNLSRVARIKSEDMMNNGYFAHTSPTYGSPFKMMNDFGISYRAAGENIAKTSSVQGAINGWMNSEGHRANILNSNFTHIGIGIAGGRYYTQMFVGR